MVDLVEFSVVDITKGRMDIQLCGHERGDEILMSSKISKRCTDTIQNKGVHVFAKVLL